MPTPDRNPTSTVRDRKSARNPSRARRARNRNPAAMSARMPARASHSAERGARHRGDAGGENGGSGGVGADHEVSGRPEERVQGHRKKDCVETGNHRCAGNLRVAEHFRDGQGRQRNAGDDVGRYLRSVNGENPPEQLDPETTIFRVGIRHKNLPGGIQIISATGSIRIAVRNLRMKRVPLPGREMRKSGFLSHRRVAPLHQKEEETISRKGRRLCRSSRPYAALS